MKRVGILAAVAVSLVALAGVVGGGGTQTNANAVVKNGSNQVTAAFQLQPAVQNTSVVLGMNCNPTTTTCAGVQIIGQHAATTNHVLELYTDDGGTKLWTFYSDGSGSNYPYTFSTNTLYANLIQDPTGSSGVLVKSDRSAMSVGADFAVNTSTTRGAGALQQWQNNSSVVAAVDPMGMGVFGIGGVGSLAAVEDGSGVSGHPSLTCAPGKYPVVLGRLGEDHDAVWPDGGRPVWDGGTQVCKGDGGSGLDDGGTYFCYAGLHGDVSSISSEPRTEGWLFEWRNPITNSAGDARAFVDVNGGYGNFTQLTFAQFQPCPSTTTVTSVGQFIHGATKSTLMYAIDTERWYVCKTTGWKRITTEDDP